MRPCNIDPGAHTRWWERRSGVAIPTVPATRQPCRRTGSAPARRRVVFVVELFLNVHTPHLIDSFSTSFYPASSCSAYRLRPYSTGSTFMDG